MKAKLIDIASAAAALAAFALAIVSLSSERSAFREDVIARARHDLYERTGLAAERLKVPLETSDFMAIGEFGRECAADGVRLTVTSARGGLVHDSLAPGEAEKESIYETRPCGEWRVRLGLPLERVLAPYSRSAKGFVLAALAGAAGVGLFFLSIMRMRSRYRELVRREKFKREFLADVAHGIKTPLAGILGSADLLKDFSGDPEKAKKLADLIVKESWKLDSIAENFVTLAKKSSSC